MCVGEGKARKLQNKFLFFFPPKFATRDASNFLPIFEGFFMLCFVLERGLWNSPVSPATVNEENPPPPTEKMRVGQTECVDTQNPYDASKGHISKGDMWKWDFNVRFALDMSILPALSKAIPQGKALSWHSGLRCSPQAEQFTESERTIWEVGRKSAGTERRNGQSSSEVTTETWS